MAGRCAAELSSPEFGSDSTQCAARKRGVLFASHAFFLDRFSSFDKQKIDIVHSMHHI